MTASIVAAITIVGLSALQVALAFHVSPALRPLASRSHALCAPTNTFVQPPVLRSGKVAPLRIAFWGGSEVQIAEETPVAKSASPLVVLMRKALLVFKVKHPPSRPHFQFEIVPVGVVEHCRSLQALIASVWCRRCGKVRSRSF